MVITTGFFDGVHLGHRRVIQQLVGAAQERGTLSCVLTFWPHPRTVLQDGARELRLLSTLDEKREMLLGLGVDRVEVLRFDRALSRLTTEEYLREVVIGRYGGTALLVGFDNRMGCDAGGAEDIAAAAAAAGLEVLRTGPVASGGAPVSSTRIRAALAAGQVEEAAAMLGYGYRLHGVVVSGERKGRTMGFPTANLQLYEPLKLLPGDGVYAVDVETTGRRFRGMCNIGVRPTVSAGRHRTVETHILDFSEDIYGLDLRLTFRRKIRDERKFSSLGELRDQLEKDKREVMKGAGW
ncbi:MAG: riboflavin biosynthesis protein RibF [Bacteroidales bacterium]|nr:riboflavin biosynthesis protein RibF [Bacteroidales bacterium]